MESLTRREFLSRIGSLSLVVGAGAVVAACGGGGESASNMPPASQPKSAKSTTPAAASDPCADESGLTQADLQMKQSLKYVAKSPEDGKYCTNCKFWQPPAAGAPCGGCQLIKGPIHADGYCTSWFARETG